MKTALIITLVALILILGGVWAYLLLNGAPKNISDIRNNIFGGSADIGVVNTPVVEQDVPSAEEGGVRTIRTTEQLVKLTDRPVAGVVTVATSTGTKVRYAVKGTGHIYEIDLARGEERRLTKESVPGVVEAHFNKNGTRVVLVTEKDGTRLTTLLGTITETNGEAKLFVEPIPFRDNVAFSASGDIFYTALSASGGTNGFSYTIQTKASKELFSVPFRDSTVLWDTWSTDNKGIHYIYTNPATGFLGYLYALTTSGLEKIDGAQNLSATRINKTMLIINKNSGSGPYSLLLNRETGTGNFLSIQTLSEKCGGLGPDIWCGATDSAQTERFPNDWYQGVVSYSDSLYRIDTKNGKSVPFLDLEKTSRERIDVTNLTISSEGPVVFKNKRDDALWLFNPPL